MATAKPKQQSAAPRRPRPPRGGADRDAPAPAPAARPNVRRPARPPRSNTRLIYDVTGIALVAIGLVLLATLLFPAQGGENVFGSAVVRGLRLVVGQGAWVFPFVLALTGGMLAVGKARSWDNTFGATLLFLIFIAWWHLAHVPYAGQFERDNLLTYGGVVGAGISWLMRKAVGTIGGHIAFGALTVGGLTYLFDIPLPVVLGPIDRLIGAGARAGGRAAANAAREAAARAAERRALLAEERAAALAEQEAERAERRKSALPDAPRRHRGADTSVEEQVASTPTRFRRTTPEPKAAEPAAVVEEGGDVDDTPSTGLFARKVDALAAKDRGGREKPAPAPEPAEASEVSGGMDAQTAFVQSSRGVDAKAPTLDDVKEFKLPPMDLLRAPDPPAPNQNVESEERREVLLQTLEDFGVGADIAEVAYGPTITRYEVALERGIKVSKIVSLADNLAMALAAIDVRIEAPIPGKSAIGIEVPNDKPSVVTLREVIESPAFQNAPGKLTFALGKDVTGAIKFADLAKMPHLLIGGSTGSGKSVGLNTLISSMLCRCTPRELKFLMIDPKKVELSLYDGIPHLAAPVITNVKLAPSIFKQAIKEMETRYDKFARMGTRNIEGYNSRVPEDDKLPYWVLVVDELADLMMQSGPEIEQAICRLAQLSRATGIHLVIATQRPSVNVITGLIKANISSRIAFAVNSAVDSRTILDMVGADRLIGRGDMLFSPMDAPKPVRIQGCFVSEQETEALVNFLKAQAQPNYEVQPSMLSSMGDEDGPGAGGDGEAEDELFEQAVRLVVTGGQASTSMLQRRFKIGYTRAARLVDIMEQRGVVGPLDGAKPREIRMTKDEVDAMFGTGPQFGGGTPYLGPGGGYGGDEDE
jgi:S-DNA-T family DNA segregation ATPase FtsK/SpoIIIE